MVLAPRQISIGPPRASQLVRFCAECDLIHPVLDGTRIKRLRSHLSGNEQARLANQGAVAPGRHP
jgi:hypothetical protein